ncbi:MAG: ATP-binding cassette domain-containing protein [Actinobacteria bacterium]|nr:ATP-binding cassette domain-containing protein [Actinomycetota bacterium]
MSAITIEDLRYRYTADGPWALAGASLTVEPGEIVLLQGESGSGKSTLLRVLAGLAPAFHGGEAAGRGNVGGLDLRQAAPAELAQRVGFLFQDPETQAVMAEPVRDVAFSLQCHGLPAEDILPAARAALARIQSEHLADRRIDQLSSGERQRVALAAVLAPEPAVLLLDEPTAQLDDDTACELVGELRRLADSGLAIVIAEHRHDRVGHLTDRVLGMQGGALGAATVHAVLEPLSGMAASGAPLLELAGVSATRGERVILSDVHAALPAGGVAALIGKNGGGKSSLLRALAGLEHATGRIAVAGVDMTELATEARIPRLAFVPQDPGRHLLCESVHDEVLLGPRTLGLPDGPAKRAISDLDLEHLLNRNPRDCSVGERERIAIAAALALDPQLLLLDEPTRGMDPGHRAALVRTIRAHAARGGCAVLATHDLELARACADQRWALDDGSLTAEVIA